MKPDQFVKKFYEWIKNKVTGKVTVFLHEGGIRNVRIEQDIKD
jgi:hypothetical protein